MQEQDVRKRIENLNEIDDKELGFAVKNNLIKWWDIKAWQEQRFGTK